MTLKAKTSGRLNFKLRGKRVKLLYTNDPKAKIPTTSGATGTTDGNHQEKSSQIDVLHLILQNL
jgi:hypothetical protein